jgi:arylsulfatase A-like enzyme
MCYIFRMERVKIKDLRPVGRTRVALFAALLLAGATVFFRCGRPSHPDDNVILISIDTLRADHLGAYGYAKETSPAIDRFARESILFENCQAQSVSTLASHASLMTSQILSHHDAYFTRRQRLPSSVPTVAALLKERGFATISFNDGGQIAPVFGLGRGFDIYENMDAHYPFDKLAFEWIVQAARSWLETHGTERFFLFLHTYETHAPYTPKPELLERFDADYRGPLPEETSEDLIDRINTGKVKLDPADKAHIVATYDAEIRSMDQSFDSLVGWLRASGLLEKTIIVFTSDHGEEFGDHELMATHSNTLFREQVHVPLIIRLPNARKAGRRVGDLVRSIDIAPTIFALLGFERPPSFEGESLVPRILGRSRAAPIFSISQRDMMETYRSEFWSITDGRWKLYRDCLYDVKSDPGETKDISASHSKIKALFRRRALQTLPPTGRKPGSEAARMDEALEKTLKSLGYMK